MKSSPSQHTGRTSPAQLEAMVKRDRNRLIMMTVAAVMLGGAYLATRFIGDRAQREEDLLKPAVVRQAEDHSVLLIIPFEDSEALEAIADATAEQRLSLSDQALSALLSYSLTQTTRHYEARGIRDLDSAVSAELAADPGAHRVDPLRARGWLEHLSKRKREGANTEEHYATLRLEDDSRVHIAFIAPPDESLTVGDFVRLDGLFVQFYRTEVQGAWHDVPLLAGRDLQPSYPRCSAPDREDLLDSLRKNVVDDTIGSVSEVPHEQLWQLMAYARDRAHEIDWSDEEEVLEVNSDNLNLILQTGDYFRGRAVRLPISVNMATYTKSAGENCLRLDRITMGWIGNFTWKGAANVIQFVAPANWPELVEYDGAARYVTGRGFFLKNAIHAKYNGEPGRAPLFVMTDIEIHTPLEDPTTQYVLWGVLGGTLLMIGLVWFLLRQDRRQSTQLQMDLIRRRRARAERAEHSGTEASAKTT